MSTYSFIVFFYQFVVARHIVAGTGPSYKRGTIKVHVRGPALFNVFIGQRDQAGPRGHFVVLPLLRGRVTCVATGLHPYKDMGGHTRRNEGHTTRVTRHFFTVHARSTHLSVIFGPSPTQLRGVFGRQGHLFVLLVVVGFSTMVGFVTQ